MYRNKSRCFAFIAVGIFLAGVAVNAAASRTQPWETFAFVGKTPALDWAQFDWKKLTTICPVGYFDPDLIKHAHDNGVRVVSIGNVPKEKLTDKQYRAEWVQARVKEAQQYGLNGTNLDFEDDLEEGSAEAKALTALVEELAVRFHADIPGSQVSVDVAWSPNCIDGRCFEYAKIGQVADRLFIMAYDEQSQIWDKPCSARANSPVRQTFAGVKEYLKLGISPDKLILGVPWYGYKYPCEAYNPNTDLCLIKEVPFRGCNCSDAAGKEFNYGNLVELRNQWKAEYKWDEGAMSPYYTYGPDGGQMHQVRFDDPRSLQIKYASAKGLGLAGVGMWTASAVDYSNATQVREMWDALP